MDQSGSPLPCVSQPKFRRRVQIAMVRKRKRQEDALGASRRRQRTAPRVCAVRCVPLPDRPRETHQRRAHVHRTQRRQSSPRPASSPEADFVLTTVKTTMNSFLTSTARRLHLPFDEVLHDMNKAVLEAYLLANIHVLRVARAGRPLEELGQSFFSRCLTAVMTGHPTHTSSVDLVASVAHYNTWRGGQTE